MKIYTRRGDAGETDLFGSGRVAKDTLRVEVYGAVDELNAFTGVAAATSEHDDVRALLSEIQSRLFDIGSLLATPEARHREKSGITGATPPDVEALEQAIDRFEAEFEPLQSFILPGGTKAAAAFHVARTSCRMAERRAVSLDREEPIEGASLRYLNRLSDLFFVLARLENARAGVSDVPWTGPKR